MATEPTAPILTRPGTADDLARLRHEREDAHRAYNDALTALDGAIRRLREMPAPPPPYDETEIASLNEHWDLSRSMPEGRGLFGRVGAYIRRTLAPLIAQQQAFNTAVVHHLNRNTAMHRETTQAIAATLTMCREELEALATFETRLIQYAQQVTPYVDTKDRYVAGLPNGLAAGVSGLSDELHKRWESMVAREQRYEARARRDAAQVAEVQSTLGVIQRAVLTLKRELEQRAPAVDVHGSVPSSPGAVTPEPRTLDAYKYVGFEDEFRGSQQDIRERMATYVADFAGLRDVLDIGCGRGEFLDLLRAQGIPARGVDLNEEMTAVCRDRGLEATAGDALGYLLAQPDASLGGIFAAQVVEHMEPDYLMRVLETAYHKLRPGSKIVLETINAACWYAFFSSYIRDLTHVRPLHPDTLRYLLVASGFQRVEVRFSAPFPDESKLQPIHAPARHQASDDTTAADPLSEVAAVVNENVAKLNGLLFTYLDYAVIGERL